MKPTPRRGSKDPGQIDWQQVLAQHQRWLRTVVFARVGNTAAVDEVMQEVSLAAVRQQSPIADTERIGPWLYRLAVRQSLLFRRKQGRQRKLVDRYARQVVLSQEDRQGVDPLTWLLADERRRLIREALGNLPRRDAQMLLLKYTEDWSYRDLASHLGISHSAVEARLHRARSRLRSELAKLELVEVNA